MVTSLAERKPRKRGPTEGPTDAEGKWPSTQIELRPVADLAAYEKNARTHSEAQIEQLCAGIREFGFVQPVLVDEAGVLIAGHGRTLAAERLGLIRIPTMVARGWSEAQIKAFRIFDNRIALSGGWDNELLKLEFAELGEMDFSLDLTGFSLDEIGKIGGPKEGLTDPDEAPELPKEPVTRLGDVWLLGDHRLVCGDSTDPDTVAKALNGVKPHLMVTDPPYGVDFDPTWRKGSEKRTYMGDTPDKEAAWKEAWALFPGEVIYIWCASGRLRDIWNAVEELGFQLRQLIIWNKMRFVIGRGNYSYNHDPCFYAVRKGKDAHWQGARDQPTVWDIKHLASDTNHGAQKPVECMKRPIENNSSIGQAVFDPFCGSGTTIIAGEMTGRSIHAIELSPAYVETSIIRWQNFTGQSATLEETGETFAQVKASRTPQSAKASSHA
jgi:DNA modification methylase